MPPLPPSVYVPVALALGSTIGVLWARLLRSEKDKDGLQEKMIAQVENLTPIMVQLKMLAESNIKLLRELAS